MLWSERAVEVDLVNGCLHAILAAVVIRGQTVGRVELLARLVSLLKLCEAIVIFGETQGTFLVLKSRAAIVSGSLCGAKIPERRRLRGIDPTKASRLVHLG